MKAVFKMKNFTGVEISGVGSNFETSRNGDLIAFNFDSGVKVFMNYNELNHGYICHEEKPDQEFPEKQ